MVQLVTQETDTASAGVNPNLGARQQQLPRVFTAIGETLGRAFEKKDDETQIDQKFFRRLSAIDARGKQQGRSVEFQRRALVQEHIASTPDIRITTATLKAFGIDTSDVLLGGLSDEEDDAASAERDGLRSFLESKDEYFDGTGESIYKMEDAQLRNFARQIETRTNEMDDLQRRYDRATQSQTIQTVGLENNMRGEFSVHLDDANSKIENLIYRNRDLMDIRSTAAGVQARYLRPDEIPEETLSTVEEALRTAESNINNQVLSKYIGLVDNTKIDYLKNYITGYFDQARSVLRGDASVESLKAIHTYREVSARDNMHRENPGMMKHLVFMEDLGRSIENLNIESFDIKDDIGRFLLNPMVKGATVSTIASLDEAGVPEEFRAEIFGKMRDFFIDRTNPDPQRLQTLKVVLPGLARAGMEDPNVFDALLELYADKETAEIVTNIIDTQVRGSTRRFLNEGLQNYIPQFKQRFQNELVPRLSEPLFSERPDQISDLSEAVRERIRRTGFFTPSTRTLTDFVDDNLLEDPQKALNTEALSELNEANRARVIDQYEKLLRENEDDILLIRDILTNFKLLRESQPAEPEQPE